MKTLLEFFLRHFDILYMDPRYRITDSRTRGISSVDASLRLSGPALSWELTNDRGQMQLSVAPTDMPTLQYWFGLSLVRQYLNGDGEIEYLTTAQEIEWMSQNHARIEELFSDVSTRETTCHELEALRNSNADRYWTRWRKEKGLI